MDKYFFVIFVLPVFLFSSSPASASVVSDGAAIPFAFPSNHYTTLLIRNGRPHQYLHPMDPHMGVAEPFSGSPSGNVVFTVLQDVDDTVFGAETVKIGNFFFLRIYTDAAEVNKKKSFYVLLVEAVFIHDSPLSSGRIRLHNTTTVHVKVLDLNDNCPFFSKLEYVFNVKDGSPTHIPLGRVLTTDADSGFNAESYFYLDPLEEALPFFVHPYTGDIHLTWQFVDSYLRMLPPGRNTSRMVDGQMSFSFKVYATQRGDSSRVRCNIVSLAAVRVNVLTDLYLPSIIVEPFTNISSPGAVGTVYALVTVVNKNPIEPVKYGLKILEPNLREQFELVLTSNPSEWFLKVRRRLPSVSLFDYISLTLAAYTEDSGDVEHTFSRPFSASGQQAHQLVRIPVVSKSTYRLYFPMEIVITISEATLVNCTIFILTPSASYQLTNSTFAFSAFPPPVTKPGLPVVSLTSAGAVVLNRPLDVDVPAKYKESRADHTKIVIPFTVIDRNNILLSSASKSNLVIQVVDINDNAPIVRNNGSVYEVTENAFIGTVVLNVDAFDPDLSNSRLSYSLYDSQSLPFKITPDGRLVVSKPLDAESMPTDFTIYVSVTDSGIPLPRSVLAVFTIHLLDVNEHSPQFVELSCEASLRVDEAGFLIPSLDLDSKFILWRYTAEDADRDGQNRINIRLASSSLSRSCFSVDGATGELSVSCPHLGPPKSNIILTLVATDGSKVSKVPLELRIHLVSTLPNKANFTQRCQPSGIYNDIQDLKIRRSEYEMSLMVPPSISHHAINLHRPKFPADLPTRLHIPENLPLDTPILQLTASDEDSGEYSMAGQLVYGIEAVKSVAAETPHFENSSAHFHQAFLLRPIVYPNDSSPIDLLSPRGVSVVVAALLDREKVSSYELVLRVCDLGQPPLCAFSPLSIYLVDLDDNPPRFVTIASVEDEAQNDFGGDLFPHAPQAPPIPGLIRVSEDVQIDTRIGYVKAEDSDITDEVRYVLKTHSDTFKIHPRTGRIRLLRNLDRETQSMYELLIEAHSQPRPPPSSGFPTSPQFMRLLLLAKPSVQPPAVTRVIVSVVDVNDNPPVFISPGLLRNSLLDGFSSGPKTSADSGYDLFVPEDMPEGAYLTTLTAIDADEGRNGLVWYSLFGDPRLVDRFIVERLTGVVRLAAGCDLASLRGQSIHLTAWASDHGSPQLSANSSFSVHILPVLINTLPPSFRVTPALYLGTVPEHGETTLPVLDKHLGTRLRLEIVDSDGGAASLAITGGSGAGFFQLDRTGSIKSVCPLDAESLPDEGGYWLTVYATEHFSSHSLASLSPIQAIHTESNGPMYSLAEVFIEVTDVNDNYPVPSAPEFAGWLSENSPPGVLAAVVSATDMDRSSLPLLYRICAGDPHGYFTIDSNSGSIFTTARPIDRELIVDNSLLDHVFLMVAISDQGSPEKTIEVPVRITILDENDQIPTFMPLNPGIPTHSTPFAYHFRVYDAEQDSTFGCVGRVFAMDLDDSLNGTVVYWRDNTFEFNRSDNYSDGDFDIHPETGLICSNSSPLFPGEYEIRVFAEDRGHPPRIANRNQSIVVRVTVIQSPSSVRPNGGLYFTEPPPKVLIVQGGRIRGSKLFTFSVMDSSDHTGFSLTYSLTTPNGSRQFPFCLNLTSYTGGNVFLTDSLPAELDFTFQLLLAVSNGFNRLTSRITVSVKAFTVREPEFLPYEFGKGSVGHLSTTYTSGSTGLKVFVNLNESALVGSLVCRLVARTNQSVGEHRTLEYTILSVGQLTTRLSFSLNNQTGELRIAQPLDHESIARHFLLISVRDAMKPMLSSFVQLIINVSDVNEHAPQFVGLPILLTNTSSTLPFSERYVFYTSGTVPIGTVLGRIRAIDRDHGDNGRITYSLVGGDTVEYFSIDPVTGELRLTKALSPNYNMDAFSPIPKFGRVRNSWSPEHRIVVAATDNGKHISRSNRTEVIIRIVPGPGGIDAPPPVFRSHDVLHLTVHENLPPGSVVASLGRFLAYESAIYGFIQFELVSSQPIEIFKKSSSTPRSPHSHAIPAPSLFHVATTTGFLITTVRLDRELHGDFHRLLVQVRGVYGIRASLRDQLFLEIQILDENDNAPVIVSPLHLDGCILENSTPGTLVLQSCVNTPDTLSGLPPSPIEFRAFDPDLGLNGRIKYELIEPCSDNVSTLFSIDQVNGLLRLTDSVLLDREASSHYLLTIQVSDLGSPSRTANSLIRIEVDVLDVNDCAPVFTESFYTAALVLPSYPFEPVAQLHAIDPDVNDTVSYRLADVVGSGHFIINSRTGHLTVSPNSSLIHPRSLFVEQTFLLIVEAFDSNLPQPHISHANVTVFVQIPPVIGGRDQSLVVEPENGLDVSLPEHYRSDKPLFLGQLSVRNAPVGVIFRYIVLTPVRGVTVDRLTGAVLATGDQPEWDLDRETTPYLTMQVLVRDMHHRVGRATIRVRLLDINDHAPSFIGTPYHVVFCLSSFKDHPNAELKPHCQQNRFKVIAIDKDDGINGSITFRLLNLRPRAEPPLISIDSQTGQLNLLRHIPPDWTGRQLDASVVAEDGGGLSSITSIVIHLVFADGPRFLAPHYTASIPESARIGEAVTTVEATSSSPIASMIYRLVSVKVQNNSFRSDFQHSIWSHNDHVDSPFTLEFNTAYLNKGPCIIRLTGSLDYESATNYVLLLEVLDTSTGLTARVYLSINVTDVNDVAPHFLVPEHTVYISEGVDVHHTLLKLVAIDPDSGYGGQISYTLEPLGSGTYISSDLSSSFADQADIDSLSHFACDASTGILTLIRKLDYRTAAAHRFWAVATDHGTVPLISKIPITIHVLDHNDNPPQFDLSDSLDITDCRYLANVDPRAIPGTFVLRLLASDPDVNDTLTYRLSSSETGHSDYFRLDQDDGILRWAPFRTFDGRVSQHPLPTSQGWPKLINHLHHSIGSSPFPDDLFKLQVEVSDGLHLTECDVHIKLDPVNWEAPNFPVSKLETWNISEVVNHIGRIPPAVDRDHGQFGKVTYELVGGQHRNNFRLDSSTGDLYTLEPLDRESIDHYELVVRASDGGYLFDYLTLNLHILDVNDNRPVFLQPRYEIVLFPEEYNPPVSHFPYRTTLCVQASDTDKGSNARLVYRFFRPPSTTSDYNLVHDTSLFSLDPDTGCLILDTALTEVTDEIHLFVEACDTPEGRTSDVLCSSPVDIVARFAKQKQIVIPEISCSSTPIPEDDLLLNRSVAACHAHPANTTGTWSLSYALSESGSQVLAYRIDPLSGQLYSHKPIDYEIGHSYRIGVQLKLPNTSPVIASHTELQLDLIDINDCSPVFDSSIYAIHLLEDTPVGSRIVRAMAHDADFDGSDTITYSLWPWSVSETDLASWFNVDSLDIESRLQQQTYSVVGLKTLRDQFAVHSSGWIILKSPLDYESSREHKFKVVAIDSVGHWSSSTVAVTVIDVNDNPPHWPLKEPSNNSLEDLIFSDVLRRQILHANVSIPENWFSRANSLIYQLNVVDPDLDIPSKPTFFLLPESSNTFFSVSRSGAVHLRRPLDYELSSSYSLKFQASDGLFVTNDAFVLHIDVLDVNDNAPVCMEPERDLTLAEDTLQGTIVTQLVVIDADSDLINSNLLYKLVAGDENLFTVDFHTGVVRLQGNLDFETKQSHQLLIQVDDGGLFTCSFFIRLHVLDVNDNPPTFDPIVISPLPEDAPVGSLIGKITAKDPDIVDTGRLFYSLHSSHDASFTIEPYTGLLTISRTLDRETIEVHRLTVLVTDGFRLLSPSHPSVQHTTTASFTVRLLDVNDSPPQFVNTSAHKLRVSELAPIGLHLLRLEAISLDEGVNSVVQYKLLTNQPEFSLNETTGDLQLAAPLDHEHIPSYFLTVEARDHGSPPLSTTAVIVVKVDDENDNPPQFLNQQPIVTEDSFTENTTNDNDPKEVPSLLQQYYSFNVIENSRNGTVIGKLIAVDADEGENGRLIYRLSSLDIIPFVSHIPHLASVKRKILTASESSMYFRLGADSGEIALLFEPDRESSDEFWLAATVSDHGTPHASSTDTLIRVRVLDVNDCPPVFDKSSYEFTIMVDRSGNVSECHEVQSTGLQPSETKCLQPTDGSVLVGRLQVTDEDADPNAGPFTCQLTFTGARQITDDPMSAERLFFVRNFSSVSPTNATAIQGTRQSGECLLYASDRLPVGSQSFVLRVNDNGLTALHTTTTVTVHVVRQANLPPEIIKANATLTYYRGSHTPALSSSTDTLASSVHSVADVVIARVTVKGKTAHDRLIFNLLPDGSTSGLFRIDKYDGSIRIAFPSPNSLSHPLAVTGTDIDSTIDTSFLPPGGPFGHLDSGLYPVQVHVSNGSLSSEETLYVQVVSVTDEMLASATIVRISNLLPSLFYMENYDKRLRLHLASSLFQTPSQSSSSNFANSVLRTDDVYILAVQDSDPLLLTTGSTIRRTRRNLDRSIDVLIAVYDSERREFLSPHTIADAVTRISPSMTAEFNGQVDVIHDVCTSQFCPRGRCVTRVAFDPDGVMNRIEIHRVSQVSPRFTMFPTCICPPHFTGPRCDTPSDPCATITCPIPRLCVPQDRDTHICVCPPPRTGPNCESVHPISGHPDPCYTEQCFNNRERGPLQFNGGSFIHWELVNPEQRHFELDFRLRTRQTTGSLVTIRWNSLRSFHLRLATGGRLVVSATRLNDGLPSFDWLVSATPLSDGHWHHIRLILTTVSRHVTHNLDTLLFKTSEDPVLQSTTSDPLKKSWWVELTIDGIHPRSTFVHWELSDPRFVGIFLGADPIQGFGPLSSHISITSAPVSLSALQVERSDVNHTGTNEPTVLRSGIVGCFRDIKINRKQAPYQINFQASITRALSDTTSFSDAVNVFLLRTHRLTYGCDLAATVSGPCASGPCLHGGSCAPKIQRNSTVLYDCHCPALFRGHHCERTGDACSLKPCQNGGICKALFSPTASYLSSDSGLAAYRCVCPAGISGVHCEVLPGGLVPSAGNPSMHHVQEKTLRPACFATHLILRQSRLPTNTPPSVGMSWTLSDASSLLSFKDEPVCFNGGECFESTTGAYCSCRTGWQGARCEHDIDECQLAETLLSHRSSSHTAHLTHPPWGESSGPVPNELCSPYETGRGICVNTPGSYRCNCTLGFTGRYCQTKNLVQLTPDTNILGLTQLHVCIIVGLLAFLFLAALATIIVLACRARGLIVSSMGHDARSTKPTTSYFWPSGNKQCLKHELTSHSSETRLYPCGQSTTGSFAGVPFLPTSPGHLVHSHRTGNSLNSHGFLSAGVARRRPSLVSSTFAVPVNGDGSTTALLTYPVHNTMHDSECSNDPSTLAECVDQDACSTTGASRLLLYPSSGGDPVPVVMMMSPSTPYVNSAGNRVSLLNRYSPASSVVFYGPTPPSGTGTPTNQGSSSYIAYNIEPPGSASIPSRQVHPGAPVAFFPSGPFHPLASVYPNQGHLYGLRPGSVVGSDRLSLGSGSDRFSSHSSSQVLIQPPASGAPIPFAYHLNHSQMQPQFPYHGYSSNPSDGLMPDQFVDASEQMVVEAADRTLRSNSTHFDGTTSPHENPVPSTHQQSITSGYAEYHKPRPLPVNLHHLIQPKSPVNPNESATAPLSNGSFNHDSSPDDEPTPKLHKSRGNVLTDGQTLRHTDASLTLKRNSTTCMSPSPRPEATQSNATPQTPSGINVFSDNSICTSHNGTLKLRECDQPSSMSSTSTSCEDVRPTFT